MTQPDENVKPINLTHPPDASNQSDNQAPPPSSTLAHLITAVIFFALGFVIAGLIGFSISDQEYSTEPTAVAQAVRGTMIALTPTPTPPPTAAPVQLTYSERDYSLGDENAPVTIVEFADYRCGYCGRFARETMYPLMDMYDGYVKFVYRDFPIFGGTSIDAAHAAQCAAQQGKFWEYHDAIFESQANESISFDDSVFVSFAEDLSLDTNEFSACLASDRIGQDVVQNAEDALNLIGYAGTPTFLINGKRFSGAQPLEYWVQVINQELEDQGITPPDITGAS